METNPKDKSNSSDEVSAISLPEEHVETVEGITGLADTGIVEAPRTYPAQDYVQVWPDQGMSKVLERVYQFTTFTWDASDVADTIKLNIMLPDYVLSNTGVPNYLEKLKTFYGMHATMRIEMRVQSTFQFAGRLMMTWTACDALENASTVTCETLSWQPSVVASAESEPTVMMDIPWLYWKQFWNLSGVGNANPGINAGKLYVIVYDPLTSVNATTTETALVTMWFQFVDVKLDGLTNDAVTPGLAKRKKPKTSWADLSSRKLNPIEYAKAKRKGRVKTMQGRTKAQKGGAIVQNKEQASSSEKPLSSVLGGISKISSVLTSIPVVADIAGPIGAVSGILGNIAASFGWSNPPIAEAPTIVHEYSTPNLPNAVGPCFAQSFRLDPRSMQGTVGFEMDPFVKDPMLWASLAMTPCILKKGILLTSIQSTGDVVWGTHVHPGAGQTYSSGAGPPAYIVYHPTTFGFASFYTTYVRCSMKYCFVFTCPKGASCRVRISFVPGGTHDVASIPEDEAGNWVSKVVDVQGDTYECFTIPYFSDLYWLPNAYVQQDLESLAETGRHIGVLLLSVVAPVAGPAAAIPTVRCSVWAAADEDFLVAGPRGLYSKKGVIDDTKWTVDAQWDPRQSFRTKFTSLVEGVSYPVLQDPIMGETVGSIKELLVRPRSASAVWTGSVYASGPGDDSNYTATEHTGRSFEGLPNIFRIWRVGYRIYYYANSNTEYSAAYDYLTASVNSTNFISNKSAGVTHSNANEILGYDIPRMTVTLFDVWHAKTDYTSPYDNVGASNVGPRFWVMHEDLNTGTWWSMTDDSQLGCYQYPGDFTETAPN